MARRRVYETGEIRVHWDSSRCIHTGICLEALPEVFDIRRRPWVDVAAAEVDAIAHAVERCPTGALVQSQVAGGKSKTRGARAMGTVPETQRAS